MIREHSSEVRTSPPPSPLVAQRSFADYRVFPEQVAQAIAGPGRSLSAAERARYEPRLGADLSRVRIHNTAAARSAAALLDADAFTVGEHIALPRGSRDGILAHELAHVVQNQHATTITPGVDSGASDAGERHARTVSQGRGVPAASWPGAVPAVQRTISPEDVASEMVGRSFSLVRAHTSGTTTIPAGAQITITAWSNQLDTVTATYTPAARGRATPTAVSVTVPKVLLRPVHTPVAGVDPYSAGVAAQAGVVERAEAELASWKAGEAGYRTPRARQIFTDEVTRLEGLLATRRRVLNRRLIQETMFNRFDAVIRREVNAANAAHGLRGRNALDPNLVKSMLFQESQLGTSGRHLEVPPSHPVKSRFNLGQVIDSSGMALLTMMEREQPTYIATYHLSSLRTDLAAAQSRLRTLNAQRTLTPAEATEKAELIRQSGQNWEVFIWGYRAAGQTTGFADAVSAFFGSTTPARNMDYEFWIHMAVLWLFEKKTPARTWADTIRAYNGSGARARHYRNAVVRRAQGARTAAAAHRDFIPGGI